MPTLPVNAIVARDFATRYAPKLDVILESNRYLTGLICSQA